MNRRKLCSLPQSRANAGLYRTFNRWFRETIYIVKRIFLTLAFVTFVFLTLTIVLGLNIGDSKSLDPATQSKVSTHMLVGLGTLTFATLVHAISLTYFMGTGRWLEETSRAYSLDDSWHSENQKIKYRTLPGTTAVVPV